MCSNTGIERFDGLGSGRDSWKRWGREFLTDALSSMEWNYLFGLFLADGYSNVRVRRGRSRAYEVYFYLQGDERELALRAAGLLRRAGLNPHVWRHRVKRMILVGVDSKALVGFLPDKRALSSAEADVVEKFLKDNGLFGVDAGIPFLAGILDGDAWCKVDVEKNASCFGCIKPWRWGLEQSKLPFLVSYAGRFVESLAQNGVRMQVNAARGRRKESLTVVFRKSGILALLGAGIGSYSWKVVRWSKRLDELRRERARFLTTGQVGRMLGVRRETVVGWLKAGKLRCIRGVEFAQNSASPTTIFAVAMWSCSKQDF